jgi:stalled ribosome rescue protein Dom34
MKATKIGIWMDHQHAFVTEFTADSMKSTQVTNDSSDIGKANRFAKGENHMHSKEQQLESDYYKKLTDIIKRYNSVILYGPTKAKEELFNKLVSDSNCSGIKIHIEDSDKMTENQRHAFVRKYFSVHQN